MSSIDIAFSVTSAGRLLPELALKATVVLVVAGVLALALRRRSAATRHLVWATAMMGVLALPLAQFLPVRVPVLPESFAGTSAGQRATDPGTDAAAAPEPAAPAPVAIPSASQPSLTAWPSQPTDARPAGTESRGPVEFDATTLLASLWLLGALALAGRLLFGTLTLSWLVRTGERIEDEAWTAAADRISRGFGAPGARLIRSRWTEMPMTCGVFRPAVLLPASCGEWTEERREVVLRHELAHVARRDVLTLALAQLACAVHWFNPLSWVALRQLRAEAERCCDDLVLGTGTRASLYADHLLAMARVVRPARVPSSLAMPMAQRSTFEGRLLALLDPATDRRAPGRRTALMAGGLAALVVCVGAMRPADASPVATRSAIPERPGIAEIPSPVLPAATLAGTASTPANDTTTSSSRAPVADSTRTDSGALAAAQPGSPPAAPPALPVPPSGAESRAEGADEPREVAPVPQPGVVQWWLRPTGRPSATDTRQFTVFYRKRDGSPGRTGSARPVSQLQGLSEAELASSVDLPVRFRLADDPGVLECEGTIRQQRGDGECTYRPNPGFTAAVSRLGVAPPTPDQQLHMLVHGVSLGLVADLRRLGFTGIVPKELVALRIFEVSDDYVRGIGGSGDAGFSVSELTDMRRSGVPVAYVRELRELGYTGLSARQIMELRRSGVTAAFIRGVSRDGGRPSPEELIRLRSGRGE